jgi:predicted proteasome-type protease
LADEIGKGDDYFRMIHMQWGEGPRRVFAQSPDPNCEITAAS